MLEGKIKINTNSSHTPKRINKRFLVQNNHPSQRTSKHQT